MVEKMETLKLQVKKEKAQRVRETAMREFGHSKGAIRKALNEAVDDWMEKKVFFSRAREPDWDAVTGALKEIKLSSVELQHRAHEVFLSHYLKHRR